MRDKIKRLLRENVETNAEKAAIYLQKYKGQTIEVDDFNHRDKDGYEHYIVRGSINVGEVFAENDTLIIEIPQFNVLAYNQLEPTTPFCSPNSIIGCRVLTTALKLRYFNNPPTEFRTFEKFNMYGEVKTGGPLWFNPVNRNSNLWKSKPED